MRWRCGGGCCWRSRRRSARPIPTAQRRLLTFVIVGGGPTGVELAGALAEIARQSLRQDFRRIQPESARIVLLEGGPHVLAPFPEPLRAGGAAIARAARRRGADRSDRHRRRRRRACAVGDASAIARRRPCCGPPASRRRRSRSRSACRSIAPAASPPSRRSRSPGIPRSSSSATSACSCRTASRCRAWRRWRCRRGRARRRNILRAIAGQPLEPFRYRDYGIMATIGRGAAVGDVFGLKISGFFAWLFWIFLHIFWLIGFRNRFVVMTEWAWAYVTLQRRVRLITGDSDAAPPPEHPLTSASVTTIGCDPVRREAGGRERHADASDASARIRSSS